MKIYLYGNFFYFYIIVFGKMNLLEVNHQWHTNIVISSPRAMQT